MIAWINMTIGFGLSFAIGMGVLHLSPVQVVNCIVGSVIGGVVALLGTLQAERRPWIRRHLLNRSLKTWILFLGLYIGVMVGLAPPLRNPLWMLLMFTPLALGNGLSIKIFGPIQDWIVRREQLRPR